MNLLKQWKEIIMIALPSLFGFATQTVTATVCLIMVGDLGPVTIGVVGVSNIIIYNVFAISSGIGHSINYLVAQNYGAGDMHKGIKRTYLGLAVSLGVGLIITLAGWLIAGQIIRWAGGSEQLFAAGEDYLELRFYAAAVGIISFTLHGFFRGIANTRISMIVSIIANVIVIALTYGLTYGNWGLPQLGLVGAGYGMLIGEAFGLLLCLIIFLGPLHSQFQTRRVPKPDVRELALIGKESGKLGMMEFSLSFSMFVFTLFVIQLGEISLAANEVALNVMSFGLMPAYAFGSTATILVGKAIGEQDPVSAKRAGTYTALLGSIFLFILGTVELIWADKIASMYTNDQEVIELAAFLISISAYLQMFDGFYKLFAGGLRGIGDTSFLMKASLFYNWVLFLPLTYLFINVLKWGSVGAWLALYTFLTVIGTVVMVRFYRTDFGSVRLKEGAA